MQTGGGKEGDGGEKKVKYGKRRRKWEGDGVEEEEKKGREGATFLTS